MSSIGLTKFQREIFVKSPPKSIQVCRDAWLSGVHSEYLTIGDTDFESRLAAVQFAPGRALALLHRRLDSFNNLVEPAPGHT